MKLSKQSYKVFLERYAAADIEKTSLVEGTIVVATVARRGEFVDKEICKFKGYDSGIPLLENYYTKEEYRIPLADIIVPTEKRLTQMWSRMSKAMTAVDPGYSWSSLLNGFPLLPAGRIMAMLGTPYQDKLTSDNCYVLPCPKDSREGIIRDTQYQMTELMSRGGGVGLGIYSLRPRNAIVRGVNGISSGSVSWGALLSYQTGLVEQGGSRRGALMLIQMIWHPDIYEFIYAKQQDGTIKNANLSVGVTEAFMETLKNDGDWKLEFPETSHAAYDTEWDGNLDKWKAKGYPVNLYKTVKARDLWNEIMSLAWESGEPGVVFIERMNNMNNLKGHYDVVATNPCGEQPLHPYGVCNLGHLHMGIVPCIDGDIDYEYLKEKIIGSVRFLDNMIDINKYFLKENKEIQLLIRRIGLGTLGLGEMLINLEIKYGSAKSIRILDKIYKFIRNTAYAASVELAKERGPFPAWETVKASYLESPFVRALPKQLQKDIATYGIRNSTILTQAPTGSSGTMVGTSTGIEPYFAFEYSQTTNLGTEQIRVKQYDEWVKAHPGQDLPPYFVTAMDITPEEHIAVQATIQKYVDASISKTINLPAKTTKEEVAHLYEHAYDKGCKGLTLYREGSKEFAPLQIAKEKEEPTVPATTKQWGYCRPKSKKSPSETFSLMTGCGTLYLTVTYDPVEGKIFETFLSKGSTGGCREYMTATSRMTSKALRLGAPIEDIIEQLMSGHPCPSYLRRKLNIGDTDKGLNCPQAIAYKLKDLNEELKRGIVHHIRPESEEEDIPLTGLCPECGNPLPHEGGCTTCRNCGYSGCS